MDVEPSASFRLRIRLAVTPIEIGSRPANGSSYMISAGSSATARASATRRAMPPEISFGFRSAALRRPTAFRRISTRSRISSSGSAVCSRSGKATFSNTVRSVNSAPNWNSMPILRRNLYRPSVSSRFTTSPFTATVPRCGLIWPPISRRTVVLPEPEPPITAISLPRGKSMLRFCRIGRSPYEKCRSRISTRLDTVDIGILRIPYCSAETARPAGRSPIPGMLST